MIQRPRIGWFEFLTGIVFHIRERIGQMLFVWTQSARLARCQIKAEVKQGAFSALHAPPLFNIFGPYYQLVRAFSLILFYF